MGRVLSIFRNLRLIDVTLCISYAFYMKEVLEDHSHVVKIFNSELLFIHVYAMNNTVELVQTLREVSYSPSRVVKPTTSPSF